MTPFFQTLEEPPNECTGQIGLLLRSLPDLLSKADLVNDNVYFELNEDKRSL